jgi:translation initiation factor IF-2
MALLDNDAPAAVADKPAVRRKVVAPAAVEKPAAPAAAPLVKKKTTVEAEAEPAEVVAAVPAPAPAPVAKKKAKVEAEVEAEQGDEGDDEPESLDRPKRRVAAKKAEPSFEPAPVVEVEEPAAASLEPSPSATLPASPVEAAGAVKRRTFATVQTRQLATPEPEPEAAVAAPVETPSEQPAADEPRRSRFATVVTRSTPAVESEEVFADAPEADPVAATAEPEVRRSRFATVVTRVEGEVSVSPGQPNPMELAALARREADAAAQARRPGGARVVGTMSAELLNQRVDASRGPNNRPGVRPGGPSPADAGATKRVVQSRDLYDKDKAKKLLGGSKKRGSGPIIPMSQGLGIKPAGATAEHKRVVKMRESIPVSELAHQMSVKAGEIAMKLMFELGVRGANINTSIDFDSATLIADIYGFKVEQLGFDITEYLPKVDEEKDKLLPRPPVVTVMGHVDHGKTSLLDYIRKAKVTAGEAGGITQHIGAYMVRVPGGEVCFLDTPGHEAFTALRARGAKATDVVVLVVAADDGVMPQTIEAINHAKAANVPIIVAMNKIDKPSANPEAVRQSLTQYGLVDETWGGETIFVEVSAKTGQGVDRLLEMIQVQSEILELKASVTRPAEGLVIESRLDQGRGPVASVLVQRGTLKTGDIVVIGRHSGKVRTMTDDRGHQRASSLPAHPVEITGLSGVPDSGEGFYVVKDERDARAIVEHYTAMNRRADVTVSGNNQAAAAGAGNTLDRIAAMMKAGELKELKVIVKGDVQGSVEAICESLKKLGTKDVSVRVLHSAVGSITESDINLAASVGDAGVVLLGFNVRPEPRAASMAEQNGIKIMSHSIIYELLDQVKGLMAGLLSPVLEEEHIGRAEVRKVFQVSKVGMVAGCMVTDGVLLRNAKARVVRDGRVVYESTISSLRHFEKDEKEVKTGFECGISVDRFNDVKAGDIIEAYRVKETAATL